MLSISTTFNYDIPLNEQMPMVRKAGFTHLSLGSGNLEHSGFLRPEGCRKIKALLEKNELHLCSIHAPYCGDADLSSFDTALQSSAMDMVKRTIDAAVALEADIVIFHPCAGIFTPVEKRGEQLGKSVSKLLSYREGTPVRLALENLPSENALRLLNACLGVCTNPALGFCYDTSHDNLTPRPLEVLEKYQKKLLTTHISDNLGASDDHMLPFEGTFPWEKFCSVFSKIDFRGIFLLEVEMRESAYKDPVGFLAEAYRRGRQLQASCTQEEL